MKKNILLPVDFSAHSNNAVNYAVDLAIQKGYSIHLYHNYTSASAVFEEETDSIGKRSPIFKADVLIKNLSDQIKSAHATLEVTTQCERGMITETLPEMGTPDRFDFVIMGTKGITNDDSQLIGSTTYVISKKKQKYLFWLFRQKHHSNRLIRLVYCPISKKKKYRRSKISSI